MLCAAQRSIIGSRYNRALSRAFLARARSSGNVTSKLRFAVGDQVMYWRGNNKKKAQWSMRWCGPAVVIGHEGDYNVWLSHRNAVIKASGNHVRAAEFEEQIPWNEIYDALNSAEEAHDFYDLTSPGSSK